MMGMVVKLVLALVLFVGSLVGGLAVTGRLDHEGTANIPLLRSFFPAPAPAPGDAPPGDGGHGKPEGDAHGAALDAPASPAGETQRAAAEASLGEGQEPRGEESPRRQKVGRSLSEPEEKGGGGHGEPEAGATEEPKDHGKQAGNEHGKPAEPTADKPADNPAGRSDHARSTPEGDFRQLEKSLGSGHAQYTPGDLFQFHGLPAGVTPEQINEAWQRVQGLLAELDRRKVVLDQQEQQLRELGEDIGRRQASLGKERVEVEQMQRELDAKIQKFQEQVKLVRTDEVAALKRNAATISSWERDKAAQLLEAQWKTDKGQDEVLKLLEFMDKDAVDEILAMLPMPLANDILKKRLRVSKEPTSPGKGG